ncbi:MAG TPA: class I SAM-dependent methyltransferase, partial [Terriglobales bacterium]|nr:class I SAM-dependent methyltransferase [Terriglobales bacterium]
MECVSVVGEANPELLRFYQNRIAEHGFGYETMWGDPAIWKSQERFRPLTFLPLTPGDVLVDIGCGTADLACYLKGQTFGVRYIGIEAVPEFCRHAREATAEEIVELDAFRNPESLPEADWYVTFGTMNKSWSVSDLDGADDSERICSLVQRLYCRARKGVAASFVTDVVEFRKPGVCNVDPVTVT